MFYFLFLSIFGKRKMIKQKFDLLLENWSGNNFEPFYERIYEKFVNKYNIGILDVNKELKEDFFPAKSTIISKNSNHKHFYSNSVSYLIVRKEFTKFFKYRNLSLSSNIDFVNISLRLLRYIAVYNTDTENLKAEFLISASDNHYNSLRYFIYKTNGIKNILLIQNGIRSGHMSNSSGDMYTYCDYYLGFGDQTISSQKGMVCKYKLSMGSLRLYNNTYSIHCSNKNENEIIFIEQLALLKTEDYNYETYLYIIDMLCNFAKEYPKYKIIYKTRPNRFKRYAKNFLMLEHIKIIDKKLIDVNITIDEHISKNSYEAILKSNVVVYYNSTMGFESLGLNKKVFCCNLDRQDFQISQNDEIGVLISKSYKLFEEKLLYLVDNDNEVIRNYYNNKKLEFMNLQVDPIDIISKIVYKEINK